MDADTRKLVQEALDKLGVALAWHGHAWTAEERELYETATEALAAEEAE